MPTHVFHLLGVIQKSRVGAEDASLLNVLGQLHEASGEFVPSPHGEVGWF